MIAMWRILLLQIKRQLARHILTIMYVGHYVLPIFLFQYTISIYHSIYDKHDEISRFSVNRTRYLMITDSRDDPIGELRLDSWLNASNNNRLAKHRDVMKHNDLRLRLYLWRRNNQIGQEYIAGMCRTSQTWSIIIINDTPKSTPAFQLKTLS